LETYPLKIPPLGGEGESKRKSKCDEKAAASFPSACTSWCQEVLGYLPRTRLRARGICHKDSSSSCVRGMSNPITPYHKNSSSNWEIEEEEERKAEACALQDLFFAP
jgi:hypothetical protein